jgi:hypothetical protein
MIARFSILLLFTLFGQINLVSQEQFDQYFQDKSLRFDYTIAGKKGEFKLYFEQLKEEPYWGGSKTNLLDTNQLGDYFFKILHLETGQEIYSRGYSDLYFEWEETPEAKSTPRAYYGSVVFPYPAKPFILEIYRRKMTVNFSLIYRSEFDPEGMFVNREPVPAHKTEAFIHNGNSDRKIDIVVLPEGYTLDEMVKFRKDVDKFMQGFFAASPFKDYQDHFNVHLVYAPSQDSGTDNPGRNEWVNTAFNTHFFTFESDRYLTTRDVKSLRDIAACVPYDQIYLLVNTSYYGGGGIYNFYNLCTSDHPESVKVFIHEFGHAFAALADEYAYGFSSADELYNPIEETWHRNITNLIDFNSKWVDLVNDSTPIPTPNDKKYLTQTGAFEGAGYVKKGIYRPAQNCRMKSNNTNYFCPVCERELIQMIRFYTD